MTVLVYGISNQKGGISEFMMGLSESLRTKDVVFNYVIKGSDSVYEDKIKFLGGKVYYYNFKNKFQRVFNLYKIMKSARHSNDFFYYNTSGTYFIFPILFAFLFKYKIISHAHNSRDYSLSFLYVILNLINRRILNKVSKVKLSCSDLAKEWVFGKTSNVIQINNAIDSRKFFYNENLRIKTRSELQICQEDIVIIQVGRIEYPKNQKFAINILEKLNTLNKSNFGYKLIFVGDGSDTSSLKGYVKDKGINDILFLGQKNDINKYLNAADIFILPSFFEGFPIVAVEAQATGLHCILSDKITKTANITGLVNFSSLTNEDDWLDKIQKIDFKNRVDNNNLLKEKGFDNKKNAEIIYNLIIDNRVI
ncbi:glycosyltransferase [Streptococcus equinus]|uniref:glycosyltransferase n=1 Tax=Streptococcus equinus TaxID=1335 RepID=UPI003BF8AF33